MVLTGKAIKATIVLNPTDVLTIDASPGKARIELKVDAGGRVLRRSAESVR